MGIHVTVAEDTELSARWESYAGRVCVVSDPRELHGLHIELTPARARELAEQLIVAVDEGDSPSQPPAPASGPVAFVFTPNGRLETGAKIIVDNNGVATETEAPEFGNVGLRSSFASRVDAALNEFGWRLRRPVNREQWDIGPSRAIVPVERIPTPAPGGHRA